MYTIKSGRKEQTISRWNDVMHENKNMKSRQIEIDGLKGYAILAVMLYHFGLLEHGYLGVDLFFVINGFLVTRSILREVQNNRFSYFAFLINKMERLCPLVFIASTMCIIIGFTGMLPDDYENLCESIVATNIFSNNVLSGITTKNYWDVVNEYKPLMHTWYLGILMQFYVVYPILFLISKKIASKVGIRQDKSIGIIVLLATVISLICFLMPIGSDSDKFYFLPYRFFELSIGGVASIYQEKLKKYGGSKLVMFCLCIMALSCILNINFISDRVYLLLIVFATAICLARLGEEKHNFILSNTAITFLGKRSYSIYIWHQIILAFYRYFISNKISTEMCLVYFMGTLLLAVLSYKYIEQARIKITKNKLFTVVHGGIAVIIAGLIYLNAGVVRNIPELDITLKNAHRHMHAEYNSRIYAYDESFPENEKINVLVVGNSFARDWANIMMESEIINDINLSYSYAIDESLIPRIQESDYIFTMFYKHDIPQYVWNSVKASTKVYGIGTKNFGESNGIIYSKRFQDDYFEQSIILDEEHERDNSKRKAEWEEYYIDLIEMCRNEDGTIPVFSQENKMISQDCRHLTKGGAQYFAQKIEFSDYF